MLDFHAKNQLTKIEIESFSPNVSLLIETFVKDSYREAPFQQSRRKIFTNNFLENLDHQDFDAKIKNKSFTSKPPLQEWNFQMR